jgi:outer membrane protein assembly factor BamB
MEDRQKEMLNRVVFIAFNKYVSALDRETGEELWTWKAAEGAGVPSMLFDQDILIVSFMGYVYALDPLTGAERWANPMKGKGYGEPVLMTVRTDSRVPGGYRVSSAGKTARDQEDAAAAGAANGGAATAAV